MTLKGIDVSRYQGAVDWAKVKAAGISFAIARCESELDVIDPTFEPNVAAMRLNGILPGAYCFLRHGIVPAQVTHFIAEIQKIAGPRGMLCVLDIERGSDGSVPSLDDVVLWAKAFRQAFPKQPLLLYGSKGGPLGTLGTTLASIGPLWLADYDANPAGDWSTVYIAQGGDNADEWTLAARPWGGWTAPVIWQFSSKGAVPGIAGNVDLNASKLTLTALKALAGVEPLIYTQSQYDAGISAIKDQFTGQIGVLEGRIGGMKGKIAGLAIDIADD